MTPEDYDAKLKAAVNEAEQRATKAAREEYMLGETASDDLVVRAEKLLKNNIESAAQTMVDLLCAEKESIQMAAAKYILDTFMVPAKDKISAEDKGLAETLAQFMNTRQSE